MTTIVRDQVPSQRRPRPSAVDLGFHTLTWYLLALHALILLVTLPFYSQFGLVIIWPSFVPALAAIALTSLVWVAQAWAPGRPSEWPIAESIVVFALIALCAVSIPPAQYLAVALKRPLADWWLAEADALLGISVPQAVTWTSGHRLLTTALHESYRTLLPQLMLPIVVLGPVLRNRKALWEYAFHFHVCLTATLIGLALFPALCAFSYYGFESLIDQTVFIRDFRALREGRFVELRLSELEGLISFPSFHVAGALMVTWAFREYRWIFIPLLILNSLLIASTVMLGAHYMVDIIATLALFAASMALYRSWGRHLIDRPVRASATIREAEAGRPA